MSINALGVVEQRRALANKAENEKKMIKEKSKLTKEEWREWTKTVWYIANVSHSIHPAVFPEEIPKRLIRMFSFWQETVLDPFAGVGTTGFEALRCERKAVCVEQNKEYVSIMTKERSKLGDEAQDLQIIRGDSRNLSSIKDESMGLVITSPPYWNKANYGDTKLNLGNVEGYKEFFREIRPVLQECYRVLMPGRKMCIVTANVNQHTNHGLLTFPLSTDFVNVMREVGFVMVNELIWCKDGTGGKWGSHGAQRPIFGSYPYPPNFLFKNVHEYILVFSKPPQKATKGPKVQQYEELMEL
jgi:site-specific DNA-methyltransferase (adenine-specific)